MSEREELRHGRDCCCTGCNADRLDQANETERGRQRLLAKWPPIQHSPQAQAAEAERELLAAIDDCVRALRRPATSATLIACADVLETKAGRYRATKGMA